MSGPDHETLSAFVDGELAPAAAAEVARRIAADPRLAAEAAKLHALRAAVAALAPQPQERAAPQPRRARRLPAVAAAAAAALLLALAALVVARYPADAPDGGPLVAAHESWGAGDRTDDSLFAPELAAAGLRLAIVERRDAEDGRAYWRAGYLGPRGCRISLFRLVGDWGEAPFAAPGYLMAQWQVEDSRYVAVSRRMDGTRFAVVAEALETMTRQGTPPNQGLILAMRNARQPCRA